MNARFLIKDLLKGTYKITPNMFSLAKAEVFIRISCTMVAKFVYIPKNLIYIKQPLIFNGGFLRADDT